MREGKTRSNQKQIDSLEGQLVLVFALDDSDPMRVRKYIVDKSL